MRHDSLGLFWFDEPPPPKELKVKPKKIPPDPVWERDDYLPGLAEALAAQYDQLTTDELVALKDQQAPLYFDIECYANYFLVAFSEPISGKCLLFEIFENDVLESSKLKWVIQNFQLIGFNSYNYDIPMATLATYPHLAVPATLKQASDLIIIEELRPNDIYRKFKVKNFPVDNVDIINLLPLTGSLKVYSGRIHAPKLQDLPFHPHKNLTREQKIITRHYCMNDLLDTVLLTREITPQLNLRCTMGKRYGLDLRSRSDSQIAEVVLRTQVEARKGYRVHGADVQPGRIFRYNVPNYLRYKTPMMQTILNVIKESEFVVGENGRIGLPPVIANLNIKIGNSHYQMGIGGLHSKESCAGYTATDGMIILDVDVTSYYPSIVLNQKLTPEKLGKDFLVEYKLIVDERIAAKHRGDKVTAECQKIVINSSFGKMGNAYSFMYSPQLVIQITVTGQLSLLLLIEMLELAGISVVSGNTDGVVIYTHEKNEPTVTSIVKLWERITHFEMEQTPYKAYYSRDVNNYIAIREDDTCKLKGAYRRNDISKNPVNEVCIDAVIDFLTLGKSIEETVTTCLDVRKFLTLRVVKGGAFKDGQFIGKTVRWYKSVDCPGTIIYAKSGNDVPLTEGCRPLQQLPESFPGDIDVQWYIENSYKILKEIGYEIY